MTNWGLKKQRKTAVAISWDRNRIFFLPIWLSKNRRSTSQHFGIFYSGNWTSVLSTSYHLSQFYCFCELQLKQRWFFWYFFASIAPIFHCSMRIVDSKTAPNFHRCNLRNAKHEDFLILLLLWVILMVMNDEDPRLVGPQNVHEVWWETKVSPDFEAWLVLFLSKQAVLGLILSAIHIISGLFSCIHEPKWAPIK